MPQILAAAGAAIAWATAGAASATIAGVAALTGSIAAGVAVGNAVAAVGAFAGTLIGASGAVAAVKAWGTVALLASTALRPASVGRGSAGSQVDLQADTLAGIPLMLGTSGTAGKILHANTSGEANKNLSLVYLLALTAGPVAGPPSQMFANDFPISFAGNSVTAPPQFADNMLVSFSTGAKPEPTAFRPPGLNPAYLPEWTEFHRTSGLATCWWHLVFSAEAYPTGVPRPLFVIQGPAVYDPRRDSTYPGGTGAQRWNDELSWEYVGNDNPYLQALTWLIGRRDNGKLTFGVGAPIEAIDVAAYVEGANVANANAWKCGGEVLSTDNKWGVLKTILQAGGGEPLKLAGKLSCHVRAPRVVLANLTGRDAIADVSITGTKGRRDRFNQLIPNYRSPEHKYEIVPAGAVTVDAYVTADGGIRSREASYLLVQEPKQAAELAAYDIVDAREFEPIVLPLGPKWAAFRPGDCLSITEPEFGMIAQSVIVQTRDLDPTTGRVTFTCRSETPGKHEYALGRTPNPPPIPGLSPIDPSIVARPDAGFWTATGGVLAAPDGTQTPGIIVTGQINDPNVGEVIVEWRRQNSPGVYGEWSTSFNPATVRRVEIRALVANSTYNVRVRYKSVRGVEGTLSLDLGHVITGSLISGGVTTIGGMTPGQIVDEIGKIEGLENQWVMAVGSTPNPDGSRTIAGIKLAANPDVSSMAFLADEIGFTNGIDPGVFPLAIVGGKVIATDFQADDIRADTITANMIKGGEITATDVRTAGSVVNTAGLEQTDITWDFLSQGGTHTIVCYGELGTGSSAPAGTVFILYCDGAAVGQASIYCPGSWGGNGLSFPVAHKPGAGWHTYRLAHIGTTGSGASAVNRTNVVLTELKR
jgi:hypothetical protein